MFKFQDKELREELKRARLIEDDKWGSPKSIVASRVVSQCDYLYDIVSAITNHLGVVIKEDGKSRAFYCVKKKKGKAKDE